VQYFGDGGLDTFMGIGDHQLDPAQTAPRELAQEAGPEWAHWVKSTLRKFNLSTLTTEELSEILGNLLEVGDVLKDVEEEIQESLKPR
jgi:hypothetical protein